MFYDEDSFIVLLVQRTEDVSSFRQFASIVPTPYRPAATIIIPTPRPAPGALRLPEIQTRVKVGTPYTNPLCLPIPDDYVYDAKAFFANGYFVTTADLSSGFIPVDYIDFALQKALVYYPKPCVMNPLGLVYLTKGVANPSSKTDELQTRFERLALIISRSEGIAGAVEYLDDFQRGYAEDMKAGRRSVFGQEMSEPLIGIVLHLNACHFAFCVYGNGDNLYVFNSLPGIGSATTLKMVRFTVANFMCNIKGIEGEERTKKLEQIHAQSIVDVKSPRQLGGTMNCGFFTTLFMFNFMRSINSGRTAINQIMMDVVANIEDEEKTWSAGPGDPRQIKPQSLREMMAANVALYNLENAKQTKQQQ